MNPYENFKGLARVVVLDPAWSFGDKLPGSGRGAAKHYNTEGIDKIKRTPLPPMEDDCVLFLWRVHSFARQAYEVLDALGFVDKCEIAWFKRNECSRCKGTGNVRKRRYVEQKTIPLSDAKDRVYDGTMETFCPACDGAGEKEHFGMGRIVRGAHEICLVAVRGKAKNLVCDHSVRSAFDTIANSEIVAPVGEHSEKPAIFYEMVETLFPGPYVEIHARKPRTGWFSVGHQLDTATSTESGMDIDKSTYKSSDGEEATDAAAILASQDAKEIAASLGENVSRSIGTWIKRDVADARKAIEGRGWSVDYIEFVIDMYRARSF